MDPYFAGKKKTTKRKTSKKTSTKKTSTRKTGTSKTGTKKTGTKKTGTRKTGTRSKTTRKPMGGAYFSFDRMKDRVQSLSSRMRPQTPMQTGQDRPNRMQYILNEPARAVRRVIRRAKRRRSQNAT
jgi:hypothetical protein